VVDLDKFEAIMINGIRGSGKSAKGERLLEEFWRNGRIAVSLTEAPFSFESLYAAIPREGHDPIPVIVICPKGLKLEYPSELDILCMREDQNLKHVLMTAKREQRMIIYCSSLWGPKREKEAYKRLAEWITEMCSVQRSLRTDMAVLIREVEMQAYSRLKSQRSSKDLKSALIDLVRLARSSYRMTVIADLQLAQDMDRAMRGQLDKWLICAQDPDDMPESMRWLSRSIEARRKALMGLPKVRDRLYPSLSYLYPNEAYYVIRRKRQYCKLEFDLPSHRHRQEKDDLVDFGIRIRDDSEVRRYIPVMSRALEAFREKWVGPCSEGPAGLSSEQKTQLAREMLDLIYDNDTTWWKVARAISINPATLYGWARRYAGEYFERKKKQFS